MTGEIEVTLTEEFESTVVARAGGGAGAVETDVQVAAMIDFRDADENEPAENPAAEDTLPAAKVQHAPRERGRARDLFERIAMLPE